LEDVPLAVALRFRAIPLRRLGKGVILGMDEEPTREVLRDLMEGLGKPVCILPCRLGNVEGLLREIYATGSSRTPIGEMLKADGLITDNDVRQVLHVQERTAKQFGEVLLELGVVSRDELTEVLSKQERGGGPSFLPSLFLDPKLLALLPESAAYRFQALPLVLADAGETIVLGCGRHLDRDELAELTSTLKMQIRTIPVVADDLRVALEVGYGRLRKRRLKELRLGEVLVEEGLISQEQLTICLNEQKKVRKKLGEILIERAFVGEDAVLTAVAGRLGCEFRRFATSEIDLELSRYLPARFAEQNHVLILNRIGATKDVAVAMADPADLNLRDIVSGILSPNGFKLHPVLASPTNLRAGIAFVYQAKGLVDGEVEVETVSADELSEELVPTGSGPEIKRIVNQLLYSAVTEGASDIHLENQERSVQIRFRIDGVLEDRSTPISKENIASVISILKVDSGLDIAERRRSQDGVFKKRLGKSRFIDFRINVHATPFGEDAVIRILDRDKNLLPLERLGFSESTLETYLRLVENPQGLILFTGPTGSGKTTTLYSTLSYLNRGNRKIVTAEDPIEYVLQGVSQYQVNEAIGNTFDDYARRFLRKDPDIILIGEIRDNKTARACVNAAMTGHLVFSTLHTNDAVGVVRRLQNLDIAPEMIADCLLLVISQRLARRTCFHCRESYPPDRRLVGDFYPRGVPPGVQFVRGMGCEACRLKGYRGRVGLYEFWEVKNATRRLISQGAPEEAIRDTALSEGFRPLLSDALHKVSEQLTTLEELSRVVSIDQLQRYAAVVS